VCAPAKPFTLTACWEIETRPHNSPGFTTGCYSPAKPPTLCPRHIQDNAHDPWEQMGAC
jgi:hypothetical protein